MRTSLSHPLYIDPVTAGRGVIGMTFCPGKKQDHAATGSWDRDLQIDLSAIVKFGASALVTLMEDQELPALGVADLGAQVCDRGLEWYLLPISDGGVPDHRLRDLWPYTGYRLRTHLRRGERIVLHCKGGLGRTGMIAARLLVELDVAEPERAIALVREARPGTIETEEQAAHVRATQSIDERADYRDRVLGSLLGGAVGDALGYTVEFDSLDAIRRRFGSEGIRAPVFDAADRLVVSDDTQMTLFTLEALIALESVSTADPVDLHEAFRTTYLDWLATQRTTQPGHGSGWDKRLLTYPELFHRRAPGTTCLTALTAGGHGAVAAPANDSKGCGTVMRVAPIGMILAMSPEQCFEAAVIASAVTHGHPSGYIAGGAMAALIRLLLDGCDLRDAADTVIGVIGTGYPTEAEVRPAISKALKFADARPRRAAEQIVQLGQGWIAEEALAIGLFAALVGQSFADVLAIAANHDGDSDSTASIAGQIYGAHHGLADLPHEWIRRLDLLAPLSRLCGDLIEALRS